MNSVAVGKIASQTGFDKVYVQPAAGDAGGAIGAALDVWARMGDSLVVEAMPDAYLGPGVDRDEIRKMIVDNSELNDRNRFSVEEMDGVALLPKVAALLESGAVVGWFQGRMEWGPRALGNRSILADPRRTDMQDLLNRKIKRRESFRPFAPSILEDHVADWFDNPDVVPYMEKVLPIKPAMQQRIPAVTHVDGTGRLQTVNKKANPRYYGLIEAFHHLTGVPVLLNTSFNENEPIVCQPSEALDCFLRTNMDVLVLGDTVILRGSQQ